MQAKIEAVKEEGGNTNKGKKGAPVYKTQRVVGKAGAQGSQ